MRRTTGAPSEKLQEALGCLDLRLEDELTRYRRQRAGLSVAPIVLRPKQKKKSPVSVGTAAPTEPPKAISFDLGAAAIGEINSPETGAMVPYEAEFTGESLYDLAEESTPPDDYLESSEHLLNSLKREEAKVEVERGFLQSLSTPFGIGSMLTLLLSSAMLGYVIMNPSIVSGLFQNPQEVAETSTESNSSDSPATLSPTSPRLDRDEFSELGLDSFSAMRAKPAPIPSIAASPTPSVAPTPSGPTAFIAPTPSISPSASPQPTTAGSSVLLPPVTVAKNPTESYQYKVELPFTGEQSLAAAQKVVPDAFVRDGKIQLAAFNTQAEAQRKAQEFKSHGLAAEVKP